MAYIHEVRDDDSMVVSDENGDTFIIFPDLMEVLCPCGDRIEIDGECPQGCISPAMDLL